MREVSTPELCQMSLAELRTLTHEAFDRDLVSYEYRYIFQRCEALWLHSGDPKTPHAELTTGKCSNGFVDTLRVLRYANLCETMAAQLVRRVHRHYSGKIDWVIGSDHASATLSFAVAAQLGAQHDFTEKGDNKTQDWKRFVIEPHEVVLQVEELITTTATLQAVRNGVRKGTPYQVNFVPLSLALVHRSDTYEFDGAPISFGVHFDIQTWDPSVCPLCAAGSERVRPKQNWNKLTGR